MLLCAFSKSETLASHILEVCPLALSSATAKKCPCKKRLYHVGPSDLRVLSCTFPNDWKGNPVRNPEALAAKLREKVKAARPSKATKQARELLPPLQPLPTTLEFEEERMADDEEAAEDNAGGEIVVDLKNQIPVGSLTLRGDVYDRISDPMEFVKNFGTAIYASKMFGCHNPQQGMVFAMACLAEKSNPIAIKRRYHIIGGNLSMRSDAMLAEFRMNHGGTHEIIERTPEAAEIELRKGSQKPYRLRFTWAEAEAEPFVWGKDEKGKKIIKTNYATPRARMQMLWARVASDAVRSYCPEVNAGVYTPEEMGGPLAEYEEAEFEVKAAAPVDPVAHAKPKPEKAADKPSPSAATEEAPFREAIKDDIAKMQAQNAAAAASKPAESIASSGKGSGKVSRETLIEIKKIKDALQYGDDTWKKILDKLGVASAKDLDQDGGDRLLAYLGKRQHDVEAARKQAAGVDELSTWANGQLSPNQKPGEATPGK